MYAKKKKMKNRKVGAVEGKEVLKSIYCSQEREFWIKLFSYYHHKHFITKPNIVWVQHPMNFTYHFL